MSSSLMAATTEARGNRKSAYQGRYWLEGDHIEYGDDTGCTADRDFP